MESTDMTCEDPYDMIDQCLLFTRRYGATHLCFKQANLVFLPHSLRPIVRSEERWSGVDRNERRSRAIERCMIRHRVWIKLHAEVLEWERPS